MDWRGTKRSAALPTGTNIEGSNMKLTSNPVGDPRRLSEVAPATPPSGAAQDRAQALQRAHDMLAEAFDVALGRLRFSYGTSEAEKAAALDARSAKVQDLVDMYSGRVTGCDLNLDALVKPEAEFVMKWPPSAWIALELHARAQGGPGTTLTSVTLGPSLSSGGERLAAGLSCLQPGLRRVDVQVPSEGSRIDLGELQAGHHGLSVIIDGEFTKPLKIVVPEHTTVEPPKNRPFTKDEETFIKESLVYFKSDDDNAPLSFPVCLVPRPPTRGIGELSLLEELPTPVLARVVGDKLDLSDRELAAQASRTMHAKLESESSDPLTAELYAAKKADKPERLKAAQQVIQRRTYYQRQRELSTGHLNKTYTVRRDGRRQFLPSKKWMRRSMGELAQALLSRSQFNDASRVLDIWEATLPPNLRYLPLRMKWQTHLLAAQACESTDEANKHFNAAVGVAETLALDPVVGQQQYVARALILKGDFHGALEALDNSRPDGVQTVLTRLMIERGLNPQQAIEVPADIDDPCELMMFHEWSRMRGHAGPAMIDEILRAPDLSEQGHLDAFMSSPFLTGFRNSDEGRRVMNLLFSLPGQLATMPITINWAVMPKAPAAPGV